jgi:hypothetical protein
MSAAQQFLDQLSEHLFWDVAPESIDADRNAAFLICRIMERGSSEDVRAAWSYYGEARVRDALVKAPSLTKKTMHFFAYQFRIPLEAFRAYGRANNWAR